MCGTVLLMDLRNWSRKGAWNSRKGERAKEEKGKETPPKEMQGETIKKRGSASTGLAETATASSQKPAGSSMKDPKGVGEVERETALPWSPRKKPLRRSKRRPQPKGGKQKWGSKDIGAV
jgi:hypothetical protein